MKRSISRFTSLLAFCVALAVVALPLAEREAFAQQAGQQNTVAVISLSGYNEIKSDVNFLGGMFGQPGAAQMGEAMLNMMTQGQGVQAIDGTKPWGMVIQGASFQPLIFVPVKNFDMLVKSIAPITGAPAKKNDDGTYELQAGAKLIYLKSQGGWAFAGQTAESLKTLPEDPAKLLGSLPKDYDVAVKLNVQSIPPQLRDLALTELKKGIELGLDRLPDEDDAQYEMRKKIVQNQMKAVTQAINELNEVTAGLKIDSTNQSMNMDVLISVLPGTKSAAQIAENRNLKARFAGFVSPDAAVSFHLSSKTSDPQEIAQMLETIRGLEKQALSKIDANKKIEKEEVRTFAKGIVTDVSGILKETLEQGRFDAGGSLFLSEKSIDFAMGGIVKDSGKVKLLLEKIEARAKQEKDIEVSWNSANHKGVSFHTFSIPLKEDADENAKKFFGEQAVVVIGLGKESFYMGFGSNCLDYLKKSIDSSLTQSSQKVPMMQARFSVGKLILFGAATNDTQDAQQMAELVKLVGDKDHLNVVTEAVDANTIRMRIEVESDVLNLLGKIAAQKQQQQQGGQDF